MSQFLFYFAAFRVFSSHPLLIRVKIFQDTKPTHPPNHHPALRGRLHTHPPTHEIVVSSPLHPTHPPTHPPTPHSVTNNNMLSMDNKTARIRYACSPCNSMTSAAFSGALCSHAASMPSCPSCSRRALCTLCQPVAHPSPLCAPGPLRTLFRISRGRRVHMPAAVPRGRNSELHARATSCGSRCAQQRSKGHSASAPRLWGATITPSSP